MVILVKKGCTGVRMGWAGDSLPEGHCPVVLDIQSDPPVPVGTSNPAGNLLQHRIWPRLLRYAPLDFLGIGSGYAVVVQRSQCLASAAICGASLRFPVGFEVLPEQLLSRQP